MNVEEQDHYSSDRNHWCIVSQLNSVPFYYTGWFGDGKPAITIDFNKALKMHSKMAAEMVLNGLKSCSSAEGFVIQDHRWMDR